eukprot:TRINITY_DN5394_c0_g1_i4.p1 TRINITY_DN5394_c0_g1~~TRINITY_DN5394_c0_g1_i4.p1  ORF type:complete len:784 (-),score=167.85 TRINITY_DN5394_c0_g1_i4:73-2316(-)
MPEKRELGSMGEEADAKRQRLALELAGETPNEVRVPQQFVGWLKGSHGRQIVEIETRTGAHISIDQSTKELGYSRAVITGSDEAVASAAGAIHEELMRVMDRDSFSPGNVASIQATEGEVVAETQIPQKYVGWLKGAGGSQIRDLEAKSGARVRIDQSTRDSGYSVAQITGHHEAVLSCKAYIEAEVARVQERNRIVTEHSINPAMAPGVSAEVQIPQQYVGWIKGSGGAQIRDIESRSGSHITIDQSTQELGYSLAKLYGAPESVAAGRQMIHNELNRVMDRDGPTSFGQPLGGVASAQPLQSALSSLANVNVGCGGGGGTTEALSAVAQLLTQLVGAASNNNAGCGGGLGMGGLGAGLGGNVGGGLGGGFGGGVSSSAILPVAQRQAAHVYEPGDDGRYDSVRLPIQCVGWLKGKQGGMIRDIEGRSGAQVNIDQTTKEAGYSMARVSAPSLAQKKIAHGLVVAEVMKVLDQSGEPHDNSVGVVAEFRLDAQYVGWVKGPRGKVVQDIQVKTGTRIDVDQRNRDSGIAIVKVYGTAEGTQHARKLIANELSKISPEVATVFETEAGNTFNDQFNSLSGLDFGSGLGSQQLQASLQGGASSNVTNRPPLANPASRILRDTSTGLGGAPADANALLQAQFAQLASAQQQQASLNGLMQQDHLGASSCFGSMGAEQLFGQTSHQQSSILDQFVQQANQQQFGMQMQDPTNQLISALAGPQANQNNGAAAQLLNALTQLASAVTPQGRM